jgi:D-galactarolactone isomerase
VRETLKAALSAQGVGIADWPVCDTHSHVYPDTAPLHSRATLDHYRSLTDGMGVHRHVLVQAKAYQQDIGSVTETIKRLGVHRARGVLWDDASWTAADLQTLDSQGIRGVRTLFGPGVELDMASLRATAERIAPVGWHLLVQAETTAWMPHVEELSALPCPVVLDHMGRLGPACDAEEAAFHAWLRFAQRGGWTKLSAPYYGTRGQMASFESIAWRVQAWLDVAPDRALWGMNWPHVNLPIDERPDDAATLESLVKLLTSPQQAQAVLSGNAAALYGFSDHQPAASS